MSERSLPLHSAASAAAVAAAAPVASTLRRDTGRCQIGLDLAAGGVAIGAWPMVIRRLWLERELGLRGPLEGSTRVRHPLRRADRLVAARRGGGGGPGPSPSR